MSKEDWIYFYELMGESEESAIRLAEQHKGDDDYANNVQPS